MSFVTKVVALVMQMNAYLLMGGGGDCVPSWVMLMAFVMMQRDATSPELRLESALNTSKELSVIGSAFANFMPKIFQNFINQN